MPGIEPSIEKVSKVIAKSINKTLKKQKLIKINKTKN